MYSTTGPASDTTLVGVAKIIVGGSTGTLGFNPLNKNNQTVTMMHNLCDCSYSYNINTQLFTVFWLFHILLLFTVLNKYNTK